jgi:hypothetical protein
MHGSEVKIHQTIQMDTADHSCSRKVKSLQANVLQTMESYVAAMFDLSIYTTLTPPFLAKYHPKNTVPY